MWPPVALTPAMSPVYLGFLLLNMTRLGWLWRSCVSRSSMKSEVQRTRTITTTPTTVPQISCPSLWLRSPRRFTWRALRSREGRFKWPSRSRRQVILSKNGAAVWRSSHGFLFWPGVYWRFLRHLPHLSAFLLPWVTPRPRSGAVCHAIILRNACIYMRPVLKSGSGPLTRRSTTLISRTRLDFFLDL